MNSVEFLHNSLFVVATLSALSHYFLRSCCYALGFPTQLPTTFLLLFGFWTIISPYYCCCALGRPTWFPITFLLLRSWFANIISGLLLLGPWLSNTIHYVFATTIFVFQHNIVHKFLLCLLLLRSSLSNITSYYSSSGRKNARKNAT